MPATEPTVPQAGPIEAAVLDLAMKWHREVEAYKRRGFTTAPSGEPGTSYEAMRDFARQQDDIRQQLVDACVFAREAFRLTREYVGEDTLPAIDGWSWFDACEQIDTALKAAEETR